MRGARLSVVDGKLAMPSAPGEYCGPVMGYSGDRPAVFFVAPNAGVGDVAHVCSPPHGFAEEADGTLTIYGSILNADNGAAPEYHGYLTRGEWVPA